MTLSGLVTWLMLTCTGLWAGGAAIIAIDRVNTWPRMSIDEFAVDFRRSILRVDPTMPILASVGTLGAAGYALMSSGAATWLAWFGATVSCCFVVASVILAEPINSKFRRIPEGTVPEGASELRMIWARFHTARAIGAVASFLILVTASLA